MINAIISEPNSFGEIKIDKMTQKNRIDPCDAIIDAWKIWTLHKEGKSSTDDALDDWLDVTKPKEKEGKRD